MRQDDPKSALSGTTGQPRNLVICCDGTGNEFGEDNSNVVKLYTALIIDEQQLGYYHPGVGTMGSPNARGALERELTRIMGLAFGSGLMANVGDAYRYLMNAYREGDRVFLFGFSRGAYTARVLAGVLHTCGLLCPGNEGLIPYALRIFASKSKDRRMRAQTLDVAEKFKNAFSRDLLVDFVGVWDTVSSVGWIYDPVVLPDEGRNPIIRTGRHAISIDERRCYYQEKLWGKSLKPGDPGYRVHQDIKQVWFPGVHSDVGGSYLEDESGLSKLALEWMLSEACDFGLRIDLCHTQMILGRTAAVLRPPRYVSPDPTAKLHHSLHGAWWSVELLPHQYYSEPDGDPKWRIPLGARRAIAEGSLIHESVLERMSQIKDYRPANLPMQYIVEPKVPFPTQWAQQVPVLQVVS
jgi:uncharacterized protein (DUF2235 family)